jgi:hypothetical protein
MQEGEGDDPSQVSSSCMAPGFTREVRCSKCLVVFRDFSTVVDTRERHWPWKSRRRRR